ncbi:PREDICTED: uncharacterized protein LOC108770045 [Trachymyrmex cornetzi]|uniref:uncharacterized protein LOC108770045 n=1 Tax=Trachymyrmex cornetzi TaxID=471704 RepID=UPI00084F3A22|nr:PREDICTED: uncharacterized protein LOC108770045 [Trachymyrmex cornetzi]
MIKDDWLKPKMMKERDVMIKRARIALLPVFGISMRYLTNKTDPGKLVPLQTYYIYDRDKSPFYEVTYIMQSLGLSAAAIMYTGVDSFLSLLVFHVCGQLENLKIRIIHMDKFQNFENALSQMTQGRDLSIPRLTFIITIFFNAFIHTCLYCAVGEILVAQCEGVYQATYKYKWYNLEPKKAKNLMMIMIRANKSMYLTAGKLFPMTMSTFCNLLKTSGGYISVLLTHQG